MGCGGLLISELVGCCFWIGGVGIEGRREGRIEARDIIEIDSVGDVAVEFD